MSRPSFRARPIDIHQSLAIVREALDESQVVAREVTHGHQTLDAENEEVRARATAPSARKRPPVGRTCTDPVERGSRFQTNPRPSLAPRRARERAPVTRCRAFRTAMPPPALANPIRASRDRVERGGTPRSRSRARAPGRPRTTRVFAFLGSQTVVFPRPRENLPRALSNGGVFERRGGTFLCLAFLLGAPPSRPSNRRVSPPPRPHLSPTAHLTALVRAAVSSPPDSGFDQARGREGEGR